MQLTRLRRTWDQVAASDPWRAILGRPGEGRQWDAEEFYQSGIWEIRDVMRYSERLGLPTARRRALDFGCGAGRLTQALTHYFESVTGLDVSPAMLDLARKHNSHGERCQFVLNNDEHLRCFADGAFDLVYSNITLQHIHPRLIRSYLQECVRLLASGGLLLFQLPSRRIRPKLARLLPGDLYSQLSRTVWGLFHPERPVIEMYGMPVRSVVKILESAGGRVLAHERQDSAGSDWESYRYAATKADAGC